MENQLMELLLNNKNCFFLHTDISQTGSNSILHKKGSQEGWN